MVLSRWFGHNPPTLGDRSWRGWECQWVLGVEKTPCSVLLSYVAVDFVSQQCAGFNGLTHPGIPAEQGSTVKLLGLRAEGDSQKH